MDPAAVVVEQVVRAREMQEEEAVVATVLLGEMGGTPMTVQMEAPRGVLHQAAVRSAPPVRRNYSWVVVVDPVGSMTHLVTLDLLATEEELFMLPRTLSLSMAVLKPTVATPLRSTVRLAITRVAQEAVRVEPSIWQPATRFRWQIPKP
jgi:hypothetical protein